MSDENIKVSELPEKEQKELLSEAFAVGLNKGVLTGYKVSTLKKKIAELKEQNNGENEQNGSNDEQKGSNDEQNGSNDEQKAEENEQNASNDEQKGEETTEEAIEEELPEGLSDEAKEFLEGKTDELPNDAEEITNEEAEELIAGEKVPQKEDLNKGKTGICHICGSRVENGKCTGCNFVR